MANEIEYIHRLVDFNSGYEVQTFRVVERNSKFVHLRDDNHHVFRIKLSVIQTDPERIAVGAYTSTGIGRMYGARDAANVKRKATRQLREMSEEIKQLSYAIGLEPGQAVKLLGFLELALKQFHIETNSRFK